MINKFYYDNNFLTIFISCEIYWELYGLFKFRKMKNKESDFLTAQVIRDGAGTV